MATIISALPYTLTNGTTADAAQVMADFSQIVTQVNANAAASGANSDITSLVAVTSIGPLTSPITITQGGTGATSSRNAALALGVPWALDLFGTGTSAAATTAQVGMRTVAVASGALGSNGVLQLSGQITTNTSAGVKVVTIALNTTVVATLNCYPTVTNTAFCFNIRNRGSSTSQKCDGFLFNDNGGLAALVGATATIPTASSWSVVVAASKAVGADTLSLDAFSAVIVAQQSL